MTNFEKKDMQVYYEELLKIENIDIDLLIAQEKVKLDQGKNQNSLFGTCYIGFLVLGLTGVLITDIKYTPYIFPSYVLVALAAFTSILYGNHFTK